MKSVTILEHTSGACGLHSRIDLRKEERSHAEKIMEEVGKEEPQKKYGGNYGDISDTSDTWRKRMCIGEQFGEQIPNARQGLENQNYSPI